MTNQELIDDYRFQAFDASGGDPMVDDWRLTVLYAEAEEEAAIRGRLILEVEDASICRIPVVAGTSIYTLHTSLYEIVHLSFVDASVDRHPVKLVSTEWLDGERYDPPYPTGDDYDNPTVGIEDWRDSTGTPPLYAIQTDRKIRLIPSPTEAGTLHLEGYRIPIREPHEELEIAAVHHLRLTDWVLHRVFGVPEYEQFDHQRSALSLARFEQYFGLRPDADLRRNTRHDTPHTCVPHFI